LFSTIFTPLRAIRRIFYAVGPIKFVLIRHFLYLAMGCGVMEMLLSARERQLSDLPYTAITLACNCYTDWIRIALPTDFCMVPYAMHRGIDYYYSISYYEDSYSNSCFWYC